MTDPETANKIKEMLSIQKTINTEQFASSKATNTLYKGNFKDGTILSLIHQDESTKVFDFSAKLTRIQFTLTFVKDELASLKIEKFIRGLLKETISLSKESIGKLKEFFTIVSEFDVSSIVQRKIKLTDLMKGIAISSIDEAKIKTFLQTEEGMKMIEEILQNNVTHKDIVSIAYRSDQLSVFKKLLEEASYYKTYGAEQSIDTSKEEKVWQYFFNNNQWIFGYGINYRFMGVLQKEAVIASANIDGKNEEIVDFLLADKNYITFVELKKPSTDLFGTQSNRSGSWCLSDELFESVSQILEYKASGEIRFEEKEQYDQDGKLITQRPYNSNVVLVIGKLTAIAESDYIEKVKKRSFELFRNDLRNIQIITYDELYERAKYIISN